MDQTRTKRRGIQPRTYLWILSALTTTFALLYWEQIALLFVISTLAMCILLLVVALSDLEGRDKELSEAGNRCHSQVPEQCAGRSAHFGAD